MENIKNIKNIKNILEGSYDLHVHSAPDVVSRKKDDIQLVKSYMDAGMKGCLIKAHYFDTEGRAYHIRHIFPGFYAAGSLVLNNSVGGLNPYAVRQSGMLGTKFCFMPTMDARNMWDYLEKSQAAVPFGATSKNIGEVKAIRVCENGVLAEEIEEILDIIQEYDMVLCSGHIGVEETLALFKRAYEKGLRKMVATHVEWPATRADMKQQKKLISYGAFLEHNIANIISGDLLLEDLVSQIKELGAEHMILSTDLGQAVNPEPVEMLKEYVGRLIDSGITEDEIRSMIIKNPEYLLK
ncbi:DUF6282 family protein [Lachnospiraceae bacterium 62-35]